MPDKSLGQHWLRDREVLAHIAECAELLPDDTVLEIGPGLGTLTSELLRHAGRVLAVEFDPALARKLPGQFPGKDLQVMNEDIFVLKRITNYPSSRTKVNVGHFTVYLNSYTTFRG